MGGKKYKGWKRTSKVKRNRYAGADAIPTMNPSPTVRLPTYRSTKRNPKEGGDYAFKRNEQQSEPYKFCSN